jgi:KDO2-lipid IV(A) lauroyltransferase
MTEWRKTWNYYCTDTVIGLYKTALHYLFRLLPIDICSNFGAFWAFYAPRMYVESDARARRNLTVLRPDLAEGGKIDAAMRTLWRNISRTVAEYAVVDRLWDAGRVEVEGAQAMRAARAAGKPILICETHLGNWEVMAASAIRSGIRGSGIFLPVPNRFDNWLMRKARDRFQGGQVAAGPNALRTAARMLQEKREAFLIPIDEELRGRIQAPAFGRVLESNSNIGYAARLAAATNAAVFIGYCLRDGDRCRFKVGFLPVEIVVTGDRRADAQANMLRLNDAIEPLIRAQLDQWFFLLDLELDS